MKRNWKDWIEKQPGFCWKWHKKKGYLQITHVYKDYIEQLWHEKWMVEIDLPDRKQVISLILNVL